MKMQLIMTALLTFTGALSLAENDYGLEGTYNMQLSIGDKVFNDEMVLSSPTGGPLDTNFGGPISGQITVPGAFTSPLEGTLICHPWNGICGFQFSIVANENGQSYRVYYKGNYDFFSNPAITGTASLENNQLLGNFTAKRK
jgi:hypothetical protein